MGLAGATPERVRRARALASSVLIGSLAAACGPIQSGTVLVEATAEVAAARAAQADELSPFEFEAAEAYLHKAREEQSYADYEVSVGFAEKSRDCARVARMRAEAATRETLGTTRPMHHTSARCRPGPERLIPLPDASEEPMAKKRTPPGAAPAATPAPQPGLQARPVAPGTVVTPGKPVTGKPATAKPATAKPVRVAKPGPAEPADPDDLPEGDGE